MNLLFFISGACAGFLIYRIWRDAQEHLAMLAAEKRINEAQAEIKRLRVQVAALIGT